jgi:hypothetical protein
MASWPRATWACSIKPLLVPDGLLSLHVRPPREDVGAKANRSYFVWLNGKPPEAVVEVVSNREGGEDTTKLATYARIGITYYAILDPFRCLSDELLRIYVLRETRYERQVGVWLSAVGLGLTPGRAKSRACPPPGCAGAIPMAMCCSPGRNVPSRSMPGRRRQRSGRSRSMPAPKRKVHGQNA